MNRKIFLPENSINFQNMQLIVKLYAKSLGYLLSWKIYLHCFRLQLFFQIKLLSVAVEGKHISFLQSPRF